jgi:uncharacterized protein (DUF924 family)
MRTRAPGGDDAGSSDSVTYDATADYATLDASARAVLDCWFGTPGSATYGQDRKAWFTRDAAFDAMLRERFGGLHAAAVQGALDAWSGTPLGALALVIVLDQFSRNLYRGAARAFAADAHALRIARQMIASGANLLLPNLFHRAFAYLPFEHDETLASQRDSLRLFKPFEAEPAGVSYYRSALRHAAVIERFGRFPHRNALLGRPSTEEECAFLRKPGSSF